MTLPEPGETTFRFRDFVLDVPAYELRRDGRRVRLERQPMDLLILLVQRRRQLVSRGEIVEALWGKDVFVDVETGVHTAIRKIRQALHDSPEAPSFIETVAGKGYRFIAEVEALREATVSPTADAGAPLVEVPSGPVGVEEPVLPRRAVLSDPALVAVAAPWRASGRARLVLGAFTLAVLAVVLVWWWSYRTVEPAGRVTMAVLPFENLGRDADSDYLANGLTEDTIVSLGRIDPERVSVIGRTSMMAYKNTRKSLVDIGRELGADYLVESSLRVERGHLRITSRLIRARDQVQVWSDSFDRTTGSILGLQQELSLAIADHVRTRLSPERQRELARRQTQNAEAYDSYLRGRHFSDQRTPVTMQRAIESFQRATVLDPNYSLAWSELAFAYATSTINSDADPRDRGSRARETALHAVQVNRDLAEAQYALGYVHWLLDWNWPAAEREIRFAIERDPSSSRAYVSLGHLLSQRGRHREAQAVMQRARELDPLQAVSYAMSSQVAFQARDYTRALTLADRSIALSQDFWIAHQMRGQALEQQSDTGLALQALATAVRLSGQNSKPLSLTGYILGRSGRTAEARDLLAAMEAASGQRYLPPYALALVHAGLGDTEAVFEWLSRAYAVRDVHLMFLTVDPKWDRYRSDPRFGDLLARCGFTSGPGGTSPDAR